MKSETKAPAATWNPIRPVHDPYEVMEMVFRRGDSVRVAERLGISPQMVRHWCRPPESPEEFVNTGRKGPLQRVGEIIDYVKAEDGTPARAYPIGHHVARRLGGVFYPLPFMPANGIDAEATGKIVAALKESTEAIEEVRRDWFEDQPGRFTAAQIKRVGKEVDEALAALLALRQFAMEHDK